MSLSNLYFRGCFERLSEDQKTAVEEAGGEGTVVDAGCSREVNTCGMSIDDLLNDYSFYSSQRGLYKSWGDIEFPWQISELTPNLLFSETNDKWGVATYRAVVAYAEGSRVLLVEEDGHRISLYEANEDIEAASRAFDRSKWTRICYIDTTIPAGIPTIEELRERYKRYSLKLMDQEWGSYDAEWDSGLFQQSLSVCYSPELTATELEKCLRDNSSDKWKEARVRRQFFYREGDEVLVDGECGDAVCLYIAKQDIPATQETLESKSNFDHSDPAWQRVYCVPTGVNRCLEYQREKDPALGYDVVQIGSKGHFVEVPVPYRLKPPTPSLDERAELELPPRVLTQAEINALPQPPTE
jgi:hypothetical protein